MFFKKSSNVAANNKAENNNKKIFYNIRSFLTICYFVMKFKNKI